MSLKSFFPFYKAFSALKASGMHITKVTPNVSIGVCSNGAHKGMTKRHFKRFLLKKIMHNYN